MIHAPSLLAPLMRRDKTKGQQIVVTLHDTTAWTHPELLSPKRASWHRDMARRAHKYADAIVAPTHAAADEVAEHFDFGDRLRVIPAAANPGIAVPPNADERAVRLELPETYLLAMADSLGLESVIAAAQRTEIELLIVGDSPDAEPVDGVTRLGALADEDHWVVIDRALALVLPARTNGFGLQLLDAFQLGTPVIHSDTPGMAELAGDAGLAVEVDGSAVDADALAYAIDRITRDRKFASRLATTGRDRAGLYDWQATAEKIWMLHADL